MRIWQHNHKEQGGWRGFLHLVDSADDDMFAASLEVSWRKSFRNLGFKLHFGNRSSETPIDWMIGLWFISIYGSFQAKWIGAFAQWIGGGHKRDLSLRINSGSIYWKLWYDDDMGYDRSGHDVQRCKHKRPWFWPFGKKDAYRSWACLRDGNQELNPLTAIWGHRYFSYTTVEEDILLIEINDFPGDEYMVEFKLQEQWRQRRRGPKLWVARRTFEGYTAEWDAPGAGIPVRNHSWKGNGILSSAVKVQSRDTWRMDADIALVEKIKESRKKYGYHPPVGRVLSAEMKEDGLHVTGEIWNETTKAAISHNSLKHLSLGFDQTDKGIAMAAASMMEDGEIDMKVSYLEFESPEDDTDLQQPFTLEGVIPLPTALDGGQTVILPGAFDNAVQKMEGKPIVLGGDLTIESISLDTKPNAFGFGIDSAKLVDDQGKEIRLDGVDFEGETTVNLSEPVKWSVPIEYSEVNPELLKDVLESLKSTDETDGPSEEK